MKPDPEPASVATMHKHRAPKNPLSPKKLLMTKWTAVTPRNREKHFSKRRLRVAMQSYP
jgi:hypothetical protein